MPTRNPRDQPARNEPRSQHAHDKNPCGDAGFCLVKPECVHCVERGHCNQREEIVREQEIRDRQQDEFACGDGFHGRVPRSGHQAVVYAKWRIGTSKTHRIGYKHCL
jgi:hypothetical protein